MFTRLRIKNFKAWQGEHQVELAPISLFLGTNSAGKTSLLQMLLLLKQTAESPDRRQHLNLGGQPGDVLYLGGLKDIISGHDLKRELAFGLSFTSPPRRSNQRPTEVEYDASFCQITGGVPVVKSLSYAADSRIFKAERQKRGGYLVKTASSVDSGNGECGEELAAKRNYEPERAVAFSAEAVAGLGLQGAAVQDLALDMVQALKEIVYLGPLRERPQRVYQWNQQSPGDLGTKGEFAIQALLASANNRNKRTQGWLVEKVSHWLRTLGVADNLTLEQQGASAHYEVIVHQDKSMANLVDVGFGVSQILPVVTLAYFVPEGSTVILEQPEIHLHPLAQTALADLFVEVADKRNVQFLVETHSENLFRRLQYLIADERIAPETCRLYFVKKEAESATLQRLEVDEYGRIRNWPDRFFGDAIGEVERQTRRMIERMAKRPRS
jgi:predicted ATPase